MGRRFDTEKRAIEMGTEKVYVVVETYYGTVTGTSVFKSKDMADEFVNKLYKQCNAGTAGLRHFVRESLLV